MKIDKMRLLGIVLFVLGVLVGLAFNAMSVWADLEASLFDTSLPADEAIDGIACPWIITPGETGLVTASIKNNTDRPINTVIRTHISEGLVTLMREEDNRQSIQPGETARLSYAVTAGDAVWGRFILTRVYVFPAFPMRSRAGSCGVIVAQLPGIPGWMVVLVWVGVSIALLVGGIWLWRRRRDKLIGTALRSLQAMLVLGAFVLAGLLLSLLGAWLPAGLLLLATIILVTAMLAYFMTIS